MATECRRCNRALKNAASILAGIGPVCATKEGAEGRLVFQSRTPSGILSAQYRLVRVSPEFVWIEDIGTDCRSVTNDAEAVVAEVAAEYGDRRIIYKDSMGAWDELEHRGPVFTGFVAARHLSPEVVS